MWQHDLVLEKYSVKHSGYFSLATITEQVGGIIDANIVLYPVIPDQRGDKEIMMRDYDGITVYECFKTPLTVDCGTPYFNIPPMTIDVSTHPNRGSLYTSDTLPVSVYVSSKNYVINLTAPCEPPNIFSFITDVIFQRF